MIETETAKSKNSKNVFFFAPGESDGNAGMKNILGGKGANLAEMTALGLPVPPGLTISTEVCTAYYENGGKIPDTVKPKVLEALSRVEKCVGKKFGDVKNPLLVSVRSGARASMPGMMDTILNLGLNDQTVAGLIAMTGNARFAWDSYRRFLQMYSDVVLNINSSLFDVTLEDMKSDKGVHLDTDLTAEDLQKLTQKYKEQIRFSTGRNFPEDPFDQLWGAVNAVFRSWNTARAITYREMHSIPAEWGTAVNVQAMVFGNQGFDCATGVAFTRNPSTGEKKFYGEFLLNAQGEDVVAGIRTPQPLMKIDGKDSMEEKMPEVYQQLTDVFKKLEGHYRDMQDIEFTVEKGRLWMLQTRNGKRTAAAALRIACDLVSEKVISKKEALLRLDPASLDQLLHPTLDPKAVKTLLAQGLPASPGGVCGEIVFNPEDAVEEKEKGKNVILVRIETSPEDIAGMIAAKGILTTRGGMTSHAAVVARGMGKCCVAGCGEVEIDYNEGVMRARGYNLKKGDIITLDGSTGEIFLGKVPTQEPKFDESFETVMGWADEVRRMKVRANAETPMDAQTARKYGAEGIGLCRTEHMFFGADRIDAVREMILSDTQKEREAALEKLLPMQRTDFLQLFQIMEGFPVTIRLLDPPLHEFLPQTDKDIAELAKRIGWNEGKLKQKIASLHEFNPMLGHRGCRLGITYPEIYRMQVRALAEAAAELAAKGKKILPEIMIPLIASEKELAILKKLTELEVLSVQKTLKVKFDYLIGTMIELPRAALTAEEIARSAEFFSFGTNDLTQTALGLSRDDSSRFLATYVQQGIFAKDPFVSIDQQGVGQLVKMGVERGRRCKPDLKIGVCGEHGGDPASIHFFDSAGLDYVSCSPYRVPIARLAAAQSTLGAG